MAKNIEPPGGKPLKRPYTRSDQKIQTVEPDYERLSRKQLAKALGRNDATIYNWKKQGLPMNEDGKTFSLKIVITWLHEREKQKTIKNFLDFARNCKADIEFIVQVKKINQRWIESRQKTIERKARKEPRRGGKKKGTENELQQPEQN